MSERIEGEAWIGIDPGLSGAITVIRPDGTLDIRNLPTVEIKTGKKSEQKELDIPACIELFNELNATYTITAAALEKTTPMQGVAVQSVMKSGIGWGVLVTLLHMFGISMHMVYPATWNARVFKNSGLEPPPKSLSKYQRDKIKKNNSRVMAQRLFPKDAQRFAATSDHNRAESALIAWWLKYCRMESDQ